MNLNLYDTLGILRASVEADIRKTYKKLALIHHPDKGGDSEKFKSIKLAFETLSDPMKRQQYHA